MAATADSTAPRLHRPTASELADRRVVTVLVVLLVLTHRLGIPVGDTSVSLAVPIVYVVLLLLALRDRLRVNRLRAELFVVAFCGCVLVTAVSAWRGGAPSLPSLLLVLAVYAPWALRSASPDGRAVVEHAARVFVRTMVVVAAAGVFQFAGQFAGVWAYDDWLKGVLPPDLLVPGFNTSTPLEYGSPLIKANGFVLLEPSFLSQYCALAVIAALALRAPAWHILVLVAGLASAVSGTGVVLLVVGLLILLVREPRRFRPGVALALALGGGLVFLSPVAGALMNRTGEINQPTSSGYARFVAPYVEVSRGLDIDTSRYLLGTGPGAAERLLPSREDGIGNDVLYSVLPKLVFEYGLLIGGFFVLFLVFGTLYRVPWRVVPGSLLIMTFFLSGGLLQPQTAYLTWLLTGFGATDRPPDH